MKQRERERENKIDSTDERESTPIRLRYIPRYKRFGRCTRQEYLEECGEIFANRPEIDFYHEFRKSNPDNYTNTRSVRNDDEERDGQRRQIVANLLARMRTSISLTRSNGQRAFNQCWNKTRIVSDSLIYI